MNRTLSFVLFFFFVQNIAASMSHLSTNTLSGGGQAGTAASGNTGTIEQKERSLTVMIPRAKYHPPPVIHGAGRYSSGAGGGGDADPYDHHQQQQARTASICSATEAKLLSYLDVSPSATKVCLISSFIGVLY